MLGVVEYEGMGPADLLLKEYAEDLGVGETFTNTKVGVFFDKPGVEVEDPFFEGEGPRADRLHALRQLHGRLPPRRQEHADEELPLVRREARRADRCPNAR